jgi:hypothetical protein
MQNNKASSSNGGKRPSLNSGFPPRRGWPIRSPGKYADCDGNMGMEHPCGNPRVHTLRNLGDTNRRQEMLEEGWNPSWYSGGLFCSTLWDQRLGKFRCF